MTQAQAYNTLGVALARSGRLHEAVSRIEQSVGLAERHDLLQTACRGYTNLGVLYSSLDPPPASRRAAAAWRPRRRLATLASSRASMLTSPSLTAR